MESLISSTQCSSYQLSCLVPMAKTGFIDYQMFLGIVLGILSPTEFSLEKFNSRKDHCHFLSVGKNRWWQDKLTIQLNGIMQAFNLCEFNETNPPRKKRR
jgi:hypothetical protein